MAVELTLPIVVRMAGPALFALLGAAIVARAGRRRERVALGAFFGGLGLTLVLSNVGIAGGGDAAFLAACGVGLASIGAAVETMRRSASRTWAFAVAAVALPYAVRARDRLPRVFAENDIFGPLVSAHPMASVYLLVVGSAITILLLAMPLAWALDAAAAADVEASVAGASTGLLLLVGFSAGTDALSGDDVVLFLDAQLAFVAALACAGAWMWRALRREDVLARNVALTTLAAIVLGMLWHATSGYDSAKDPFAAAGLARLVGWAVVTVALVRAGWLDTQWVSRHRAGLAATALAALFIVAQVAQEYLNAEYGLLMGGLVAGAFLFAAHPLQRAIERVTGQGATDERARAPAREAAEQLARREEVYLNAARLAVRDRRLSRAEERHLHRLAEELGLGPARAHDLLVQAEEEAGVASA